MVEVRVPYAARGDELHFHFYPAAFKGNTPGFINRWRMRPQDAAEFLQVLQQEVRPPLAEGRPNAWPSFQLAPTVSVDIFFTLDDVDALIAVVYEAVRFARQLQRGEIL